MRFSGGRDGPRCSGVSPDRGHFAFSISTFSALPSARSLALANAPSSGKSIGVIVRDVYKRQGLARDVAMGLEGSVQPRAAEIQLGSYLYF